VDTIDIGLEEPTRPSETTPRFSDHAATFLSTEHWSLLSARSLAWNESFSRVSVFLTTLSASAVALALVADASGFGSGFNIFALVLFPIVLFLGIATYLRLVQVNLEDIYLVAAMNRLRRAYVDAAPEIRPYLSGGVSDDEEGVWTSYLLGRAKPHPRAQFLASTPTLVATLDSVIATAGSAALALQFEASTTVVVGVCVFVFISVWTALFSLQLKAFNTVRKSVPRYPSQEL
jgi:hypothetical protein